MTTDKSGLLAETVGFWGLYRKRKNNGLCRYLALMLCN